MKQQLRHLALDIGNVCIRIAPELCLKMLGFDSIAAAAELIQLERQFECGRMTAKEFQARAVKMFRGTISPEQFQQAFFAILREPVPGMEELILSLPARGIQPVFFSDISDVHLELTRKMFRGAEAVPDGVYSFKVGAMKPDPAFFTEFERRFGAPCLYVDDRKELIEAARLHGWNAEVFSGADQLEKLLFPEA